jgi:hypothetical protein
MDSDQEPRAYVDDEALPLVLAVKRRFRESQDAILAEFGLSWNKYIKLEEQATREAETSMKDVNVRLENGYYASLEPTPIKLYQGEGKVIGQRYKLKIHTVREQ